jgi:REP element-mobilizing transposase RayT
MRRAREKVSGRGCYYHLMNRLAGARDSHPLDDVDRERGMRLLRRLSGYYLLEIVSTCWMGNHFHVVLYAPSEDELPSASDIASRHNAFYPDVPSRQISSRDKASCHRVGRNMVDISRFMKDYQQRYALYYNRAHDRRGHVWGDRFKSVILDRRDALWSVVKYVELNPVRAGLVSDPADYRHCSWGWKSGSGKHPFEAWFVKHMRSALGGEGDALDAEGLFAMFRGELARTIANESGASEEEMRDSVKAAERGESMPLRFLRRTRHWSDGGIIGSKEFVRETAALFRGRERVAGKRLSRGVSDSGAVLYCFKRLRLTD